MSNWEIENTEDGSFGDPDTDVEPVGGNLIGVRRRGGSGYGEQQTTAYLPIGLMANFMRAQGFVVTATSTVDCVACKRFVKHRDDARFPKYRQMYADNLAEHRADVHGEVSK